MTEYGEGARGAGPEPPTVSGWAVGGIAFAGSIMLLVGSFQALTGLAAIIHDDFFVVGRNYAFDLDVTAWGWIHLIVGIVVALAGLALFAGRAWAAVTALILALISAISNFFFIPYYPWWSLLIIGLDVWVIWALTRPGAIRA
ncbi:MAG TPA: hypothetical protein VH306_07175 [Gaiellaceae bacterium]|jgi:hypothetical protein